LDFESPGAHGTEVVEVIMNSRRILRNAVCFLILCSILNMGCWGRKFFNMPGETIDASTKIDSLLDENALLQRRVYMIEEDLREQREYERNVNAQVKLDLEALMDQVNALQQGLREYGLESSYKQDWGRSRAPDTLSVEESAGSPGRVGDSTAVSGTGRVEDAGDSAADAVVRDSVASGTVVDTTGAAPPHPVEMHRQIYLDLSRGNYDLALEESALFLEEYPDHNLSEEVIFMRGECYLEQERHFDALKEFSTILQRYPHGRKVPATLFRMVEAYRSIGEDEIAAGIARRLIKEHPYSEEAKAAEEQYRDLLTE